MVPKIASEMKKMLLSPGEKKGLGRPWSALVKKVDSNGDLSWSFHGDDHGDLRVFQ